MRGIYARLYCRLSRGCPWWLYICSQLGFTSIFCLLLQVEVLGLVGFVYPSSGLLPWQEPGRQISRTEGSYPRHLPTKTLWINLLNFFYQDMFAKMFLFSLWQILFYEKSSLWCCALYKLVHLKIIINGIILTDNTRWFCWILAT
jgi:hypothetical protein